jgi:hypothetical protein
MRTSERVLILLIVTVGALILYTLSIFMDFSVLRKADPVRPLQLDEPDEDENPASAHLYNNVRPEPRAGNLPQNRFFGESDSDVSLSQGRLEAKLRKMGPRLQIPLKLRQSKLRSELVRRGYQSDNFIRYQVLGLDDLVLRESEAAIESSLTRGQFGRALTLLDDVLDEVPAENLQVRAKIYMQAIEISLMAGDPGQYEEYSKSYFKVLKETLDIFRNSQLMEYHQAREKIYKLQRQLDSSKSGSLLTILKAIHSGGISPLEIVTGLKASARRQGPSQNKDGFRPLNPDIKTASEEAHRLFKNFKN